MSHVSPVFTEYERQVLHEIAVHTVQPNAVQRLLETAGRPIGKLLKVGRESESRALRGFSQKIHGWIEEGLIKTFRVANQLTNDKDISRRYAKPEIGFETVFDRCRFIRLGRLDVFATSLDSE